MTLNGMLISGTGGSSSSDGEYSVIEGSAFVGVVLDDDDDDNDGDGTGVNVARAGNTSTPRLASAGNF
eukprot:CAMPEP_0201641658 /NCGR_PEP_ID=MMETSP0493-20130528/24600_1 /ASSEMBLY_ACC=CAM_ASM_000838 /TAXON_ID=420259 /ORGANISM="Thalassiosira gravida, Strain GMp14c1" /LENGTH=67 /DNA_ID=CAMNT_0048115627 /DNA_START=195 /DNA_END=398 /DNA_ORIENTATION=-